MIRAILASACVSLALVAQAGAQPDVGFVQRLNAQVPLDLVFRDEQGKSVELSALVGARPVILVLGYYRCPRLCSLSFNNLSESLRKIDYKLGKDFAVVAVSIDPRETPELAAAKKNAIVEHYGRAGAEKGWHFLTGEKASIDRLAEAVGFRYAYDADRDLYAHASGIMVLTTQGKVSRYFFGLEYSHRDVRFGLEDASAGNIGSPIAQPLRMLCFAYDPDTGKYTLMTMRLVQAASVLTVLILGIFLIRTWLPRTPRRPSMQATGIE